MKLALALSSLVFLAPGAGAQLIGDPLPTEPFRPNVLIILADDLGIDAFEPTASSLGWSTPCAFSEDLPCLPNIERIMAEGVLFREAWASPSCSPTRAALLTGRHGMNTGIGKPINSNVGNPNYANLQNSELLIPEFLASRGYTSGAFGKWHLSGTKDANATTAHCTIEGAPWLNGFSTFQGSFHHVDPDKYCMDSLKLNALPATGGCNTTVTRDLVTKHLYAETFDDAQAWIAAREGAGQRWMCYLAPQGPFEHNVTPPAGTWGGGAACPPITVDECEDDGDLTVNYRNKLQYIDDRIGALLDSIDAGQWFSNTVVFFIGDNGTPIPVLSPPFENGAKGKETLYEGGVRVPFVVGGAGIVRRGVSDEMIHVVDVFPTIAGMLRSGQPTSGIDGKNFAPYLRTQTNLGPRDFLFSEHWDNNTATCDLEQSYAYRKEIGGVMFKLIWDSNGTCVTRRLFNLDQFPCETEDLAGFPNFQSQLDELVLDLDNHLGACSLMQVYCQP